MNVGFLGAGYIAKWHAEALRRTPGARLAGVCDLSSAAAQNIAAAYDARVYDTLDAMLASGEIDAVHILTPPDRHGAPARAAIEAGKHVFVEKPLALTAAEAYALDKAAAAKNVALGVGHNFLMLPGYERLKTEMESGAIGPVDSIQVNWRMSFPPLRAGPFGLWMLRAPENVLFEIGPHLFAFLAEFFEDFSVSDIILRHPVELPDGVVHFQSWRITGIADGAVATIDLSLIEGAEDRSVEIRGVGALARFDFANDVYRRETPSTTDPVAGPLAAQASMAWQSLRAGLANAWRQGASLNAYAPYGLGITRACRAFYEAIAESRPIDSRLSGGLAARAISMMERVKQAAAPSLPAPVRIMPARARTEPDILVIGGSGFIGRRLVAALADRGHGVRVFSRGRAPGFERSDGRVEVFTGDLKSEDDLLSAMNGVKGVFHLARAEEKSWQGYLENDVAVTRLIGETCLKAGVRRLVYTGTIASYDASDPERSINEDTPFDAGLERRNLYARSKAACEKELLALAKERALPLVIIRPGVVVGRNGPLQHWGIAMWRGATSCKLWGRGENILPFVSVDDCAQGLVLAMNTEGIEGRSFNLVGDPMLSARDYLYETGRAVGVSTRAAPTPIWRYYVVDLAKYWMKRFLARQSGLTLPTYRDWKSRALLSPFRNEAAKEALGWRPESDRERFVTQHIAQADLFGIGGSSLDAGRQADALKRCGDDRG